MRTFGIEGGEGRITFMLLIGSGLIGLLGLRKKFKK
jgi:hypothetical protein